MASDGLSWVSALDDDRLGINDDHNHNRPKEEVKQARQRLTGEVTWMRPARLVSMSHTREDEPSSSSSSFASFSKFRVHQTIDSYDSTFAERAWQRRRNSLHPRFISCNIYRRNMGYRAP